MRIINVTDRYYGVTSLARYQKVNRRAISVCNSYIKVMGRFCLECVKANKSVRDDLYDHSRFINSMGTISEETEVIWVDL